MRPRIPITSGTTKISGKARWAGFALAVLILLLFGLSGCHAFRSSGDDGALTVYLWDIGLMKEYAPFIQSQVPDEEIEWVTGNNDLDFYRFLQERGELPDIITNRRHSLYDAEKLRDYLLDLSKTEAAASFYTTYLENYRYEDGSINWLPACGELDGILANRDLFDRYGISLPANYDSFIAACRAFEQQGIRGFAADFHYDYTCLEILQGLSIPSLMSLEGKIWRMLYESPEPGTQVLDKEIWPDVFRRMERFIHDAGLGAEDIALGHSAVKAAYVNGEVAMIRGTGGDVLSYPALGSGETVFLPYFSDASEDGWLLTYPAFHVALNRGLEKDEPKRKLAFRVLQAMLSDEGQNILAQSHNAISYNKNVTLNLAEELENLKPLIESNRLYVRLASNDFFDASLETVQQMLTGEMDAAAAYEAFSYRIQNPREEASDIVVTLKEGATYGFQKNGGNAASSSVANTLREAYGSQLLLAPSYFVTGSLFPTGYTEKMLGYVITPNISAALAKSLTGAEIREIVRCAVEGNGSAFTPFNRHTLPVASGFAMEVKETASGGFRLAGLTVDGRPLEDETVYSFVYLDNATFAADFLGRIFPESGEAEFAFADEGARDRWVSHLKVGNQPSAPTAYIRLY